MIINSLRLLAVILLVIILIIKDIPFKSLFKDSMIQFYLALTCMVFLLFIDNIFGFILSICLLLLYFRVYTSELKNKKENKKEGESSESSDSESHKENKEHKHNHGNKSKETCETCVMNMANINADKKIPIPSQTSSSDSSGSPGKPTNNKGDSLVPYITEENLLAAQTNIVNPLEYNKETHGVDKGIYNEEVYGSQGLDTKNIHIRGYDTNNIYLGSLSYDIL